MSAPNDKSTGLRQSAQVTGVHTIYVELLHRLPKYRNEEEGNLDSLVDVKHNTKVLKQLMEEKFNEHCGTRL